MFAVIFTVTVFGTLSAIDANTGCATENDVTELNTIVDLIKTSLDDIKLDTSLPIHVRYETILDLVCDNQGILTEAKKLEQMVVSCPELVTASNVGTLEFGPLTFNDLLADFQGFDHFCGCKALLLEVLVVDLIQTDITHSDPSAFYKDLINMTAVCMLTSPSHPVNFTQFATLVEAHKTSCPSVFQYSNINMVMLADFITRYCRFFSPENFACALNNTMDNNFFDCLMLVDQNLTSSIANNGSENASYFRCRRSYCVDATMAECTNKGIVSYMYAVDILQTDKQFQWTACVPTTISEATSYTYSTLSLLAVIVYTGILRYII